MATVAPEPSALSTRSGKLTLTLLCAVAFLDFVDASIINVALPSIRQALHFSVQGLQWVPSGYLLTYGGFMLLGGRAADLLGRRRVLVAGTLLLGLSSLVGGLAGSAGVLVGARLAQGLGGAMMLPAALSILTTTFKEGKDRHTAVGAWGAVGGLSAAAGVVLGGLLAAGPGWRWVMFVNPLACVFVLGGIFRLVSGERRRAQLHNFDLLGAVLATGGMLLLVYALVRAPTVGWNDAATIGGLAGALALLAAFVVNELRHRNPLVPLSIFRINGLGFSDATQLVTFAGFLAIFFFLTLYMQNVLGYSPIRTGLAYLPLTFATVIAALRPAPRDDSGGDRHRPGVRRRHHRRQRRRATRQGRSSPRWPPAAPTTWPSTQPRRKRSSQASNGRCWPAASSSSRPPSSGCAPPTHAARQTKRRRGHPRVQPSPPRPLALMTEARNGPASVARGPSTQPARAASPALIREGAPPCSPPSRSRGSAPPSTVG